MKSEPLVSDFSMPSMIHENVEPYKDGVSQNYFDNADLASSNKEIDFKISMVTGVQ